MYNGQEEIHPKFSLRGGHIYSRDACLNPDPTGVQPTFLPLVLHRSTEAGKKMIQSLDFWVTQFWRVPLYTAGNVPKVIASASLHKKLLSLKIKINVSIGLIQKSPTLQHFDFLTYGMPQNKPKLVTESCHMRPVTTCHLTTCHLILSGVYLESRKLWFLTLSKGLWFCLLHKFS